MAGDQPRLSPRAVDADNPAPGPIAQRRVIRGPHRVREVRRGGVEDSEALADPEMARRRRRSRLTGPDWRREDAAPAEVGGEPLGRAVHDEQPSRDAE